MARRWLSPWLLLALTPLAHAGDAADAADWLLKMSEAAKSSNYQGVVIYRGDDMLESFRVTHRYQDGVERERVQSLTGEPRDILKQDGKTICLMPKSKRISTDQPTPQGLFPGLTAEKVQRLAQVYEFEDLGTQRVAGRVCRGIAITPRDQFRYGYEVWADAQSAVPLKVNLLGRDGRTLEQMMFTQVSFPERIADEAFAVAGASAAQTQAASATPQSAPQAMPVSGATGFGRLPPGYQVMRREVRTLANDRGVVEHVLLSDGLSAISIFSTRRAVAVKPLQGVTQMGAVHAYRRSVGSLQITVVGEAPRETVKLVGDSFQPPVEAPAAEVEAPK